MSEPNWAARLSLILGVLACAPTAGADILPSPPHRPGPILLPPACPAVPIRSVEAAQVTPGNIMTITAEGTTSTGGWRQEHLAFQTITHADSREETVVYQFVACPPTVGTEVLTHVKATTVLSMPAGVVHHIRIEAATNAITLNLDPPPSHR